MREGVLIHSKYHLIEVQKGTKSFNLDYARGGINTEVEVRIYLHHQGFNLDYARGGINTATCRGYRKIIYQ